MSSANTFPDPVKELILARYVRKAIEWMLAIATVLMGAVFLLAKDVFDGRQVFDVLQYIAPADWWGVLYLVLGCVRICVLVVNGWWPRSPTARYWLSGVTVAVLWTPLCFSYAVRVILAAFGERNSVFLPGAIGFPMIACIEALVMLTMRTWMEIVREQYKSTQGAK